MATEAIPDTPNVEALPYEDIAVQLGLIEQHLREHPVSADPALATRTLDALICARAVIGELAQLAGAEPDGGAGAPG